MTPAEKRRFIRDLTRNVTREVLAKVPQMPEEWDGHELRRFIADKFEESAMTVGTRDPHYRRRTRAYRNAVLVANL